MPNVKYLFFHTAAADIPNVDAKEIDKWHKARGFSGIGYHYVIIDDRHHSKEDGEVEMGRPENRVGAHVLGVNEISLGVCCVGHGDRRDFTQKQKRSLVRLLAELARKYNVKTKNILGHREVNKLIEQGKVAEEYRTDKSCPGNRVRTEEIRELVARELGESVPEMAQAQNKQLGLNDLKAALELIAENESALGNATPEWRAFYNNGEIRGIVQA